MFYKLKEELTTGAIQYPKSIQIKTIYPTEVLFSVEGSETTEVMSSNIFTERYIPDETKIVPVAEITSEEVEGIDLSQVVEEIEVRLQILKAALNKSTSPVIPDHYEDDQDIFGL